MKRLTAEQLFRQGRDPDTLPQLMLRNCFDPITQSYRFARLYLGFNLVYQEGIIPQGLISIPIPFLRHDIKFVRFKEVIFSGIHSRVEKRLEEEITRLKRIINQEDALKPHRLTKVFAESYLEQLEYVKYGVTK